jgi:hypothetical protein
VRGLLRGQRPTSSTKRSRAGRAVTQAGHPVRQRPGAQPCAGPAHLSGRHVLLDAQAARLMVHADHIILLENGERLAGEGGVAQDLDLGVGGRAGGWVGGLSATEGARQGRGAAGGGEWPRAAGRRAGSGGTRRPPGRRRRRRRRAARLASAAAAGAARRATGRVPGAAPAPPSTRGAARRGVPPRRGGGAKGAAATACGVDAIRLAPSRQSRPRVGVAEAAASQKQSTRSGPSPQGRPCSGYMN